MQYNVNQTTTGQFVTRKQASLLSRSLMVAGIGFAGIFAIAMGIYFFLQGRITSTTQNTINILYGISGVLLFISFFMSIWVVFRLQKCATLTIFFTILFYVIAEGIAFGILFLAIGYSTNVKMYELLTIFLLAGAIFFFTGVIGQILSNKAYFTLTKFIIYATIIYIVSMFIILIVALCLGKFADYQMMFLINAIGGFLMILYLVWDFATIKKLDSFISMQDSEIQQKYVLFFGYKLLIDFVGLLWYIIRIYLAARR